MARGERLWIPVTKPRMRNNLPAAVVGHSSTVLEDWGEGLSEEEAAVTTPPPSLNPLTEASETDSVISPYSVGFLDSYTRAGNYSLCCVSEIQSFLGFTGDEGR